MVLSVNWKPGDIAICITPGSPMENREVTIVEGPFRVDYKPDFVYIVDPGMPVGPGPYLCWGAERRHLRPLPDPNSPSSWDECVFKPRELVRG